MQQFVNIDQPTGPRPSLRGFVAVRVPRAIDDAIDRLAEREGTSRPAALRRVLATGLDVLGVGGAGHAAQD